MKALKTVLVIAVAAATLAVNSAQAAGINKREAAQRHSIKQGIDDGSLTRPEAKRLVNGQRRLEAKEQHFRSDGELTARERINLQSTADVNQGRIYRQRHDDQVRESTE
jgi:hypothetical protein